MTMRTGTRVLFPIVAMRSDRAARTSDDLTALDTAVDRALGWWGERLGCRPFAAVPAVVLREALLMTERALRAELSRCYVELAGEVERGLVYVVGGGVVDGSCLASALAQGLGHALGVSRDQAEYAPGCRGSGDSCLARCRRGCFTRPRPSTSDPRQPTR